MNRFQPIWTTYDFRKSVIAFRAAAAYEYTNAAPVIDIRTRERLA